MLLNDVFKKGSIFPLGDIALKNTMKELTGLQTEEENAKIGCINRVLIGH